MFLDVKDLALHPVEVKRSFLPGTIDYRSKEFRQAEPLTVVAAAELVGREIHIVGHLETTVELTCARCLEAMVQEVRRDFDLFYRPLSTVARKEEVALGEEETEIGFFSGDGLYLSDVLAEQVILSLPMKPICKGDCRGLCPHCGANLNRERCGCVESFTDPRLSGLAQIKEDWWKKE